MGKYTETDVHSMTKMVCNGNGNGNCTTTASGHTHTHTHTPMQTVSLTACNFVQRAAYRTMDFISSVVAMFLVKVNNFILCFIFYFHFHVVQCTAFRCYPFIFCHSFFFFSRYNRAEQNSTNAKNNNNLLSTFHPAPVQKCNRATTSQPAAMSETSLLCNRHDMNTTQPSPAKSGQARAAREYGIYVRTNVRISTIYGERTKTMGLSKRAVVCMT